VVAVDHGARAVARHLHGHALGDPGVTFALGIIAGGLAGMLYLIAQPSTMDLASPDALRFVSIMTVVSVVGGLAGESVFRKRLGGDVAQTAVIAVRGGSLPRPGRNGRQ